MDLRCALMPQLSAAAALQLALLLTAVPAQYYISRWSGATAVQRYHATSRLLRLVREWSSSYLNGTAWMDWSSQEMAKIKSLVGLGQNDEDPSQAVFPEMMIHDNDQGFFGASTAVRSPRPSYVFLRVGDVVMESKGHMIGVVVSWDTELRAPAEWVDKMYADPEDIKAEKTPHYKVLFRGPEPSSFLVAYLPQTQLERVTGVKPDIPTLEHYFTHFDGERFAMQPWLRERFPEDEEP